MKDTILVPINVDEHIRENHFDDIISDIATELLRAEKLHPGWTSDMYKGLTIITEEVGELAEAIQKNEENENEDNIKKEAVEVAAMAIRFLMNLEYKKKLNV